MICLYNYIIWIIISLPGVFHHRGMAPSIDLMKVQLEDPLGLRQIFHDISSIKQSPNFGDEARIHLGSTAGCPGEWMKTHESELIRGSTEGDGFWTHSWFLKMTNGPTSVVSWMVLEPYWGVHEPTFFFVGVRGATAVGKFITDILERVSSEHLQKSSPKIWALDERTFDGWASLSQFRFFVGVWKDRWVVKLLYPVCFRVEDYDAAEKHGLEAENRWENRGSPSTSKGGPKLLGSFFFQMSLWEVQKWKLKISHCIDSLTQYCTFQNSRVFNCWKPSHWVTKNGSCCSANYFAPKWLHRLDWTFCSLLSFGSCQFRSPNVAELPTWRVIPFSIPASV